MANYPRPPKGSRHPANTHHRSGVKAELRAQRQKEAKERQAKADARRPRSEPKRADQELLQ